MHFSVPPYQLYHLIHQDIQLIDLRDSTQYNKCHIIHSINIPYDSFFRLFIPNHKPLYLICSLGIKSKQLCIQLRNAGYDCYYIEGGINEILKKFE